MEYEVTLTIKVDKDLFLFTDDAAERQDIVSDQVRNALYDLDIIRVMQVQSEERDT